MKNDLPDVTNVCSVNQGRKHCLHHEEDGYCCDCKRWHPDMCEKQCGQPKDGHDDALCAPLYDKVDRSIFDLVTHIYNQREHSLKTFGPMDGGQTVQGILKHIEKEVEEIRKDPSDLEEYIDVMILAMDAAYRSGFTPEQIAEMLMKKQLKNEARQWPDWREVDLSQPLEHIRTEESELPDQVQERFGFDANGTPV
jgi:hypothetical protein